MKKALIVGPKKSQHIQKWYERSVGLNLKFITIDPGGSDFIPEVEEISIENGSRILRFLILIPLFLYTYWKYKPNVVNFHYLSSYGLLALLVPKKNLVLNTWGSDVNNYIKSNNRLHLFLIRKALKRFTWISTPAEHMKQKLIELGGNKDIIDVYQYGVPVLNRKKDKSDNIIRFLSNRNWDSLYRVDVIIDAFVEFITHNQVEAELYIYGRGGEIKAKLDTLLFDNPGLEQYIKVKGYVRHKIMLEEITNMDVFISVPEIDGMPLSLLEAMEIGLLPIVSNIDANNEWINTENGIICAEVNAQSLSAKMLESYSVIKEKTDGLENLLNYNRNLVSNKGRLQSNTELFISKINQVANN
ncbi:glycosyltransferase [Pseudoalteromonas sp. SA25]|uniref:glycosyltransferase n=1 Tax=Pseudoalteromonas sp. SA25 TaxID=2686347 RepID=UPI0013FD63F5|nr:glycosyltransferase [Pseudoalteromonas sp. SA25]